MSGIFTQKTKKPKADSSTGMTEIDPNNFDNDLDTTINEPNSTDLETKNQEQANQVLINNVQQQINNLNDQIKRSSGDNVTELQYLDIKINELTEVLFFLKNKESQEKNNYHITDPTLFLNLSKTYDAIPSLFPKKGDEGVDSVSFLQYAQQNYLKSENEFLPED